MSRQRNPFYPLAVHPRKFSIAIPELNMGLDGNTFSLFFDAVDDLIAITSSANQNNLTHVKIVARVKPTSYGEGNGGRIFAKGTGTTSRLRFGYRASTPGRLFLAVQATAGAVAWQSDVDVIPLNQWSTLEVELNWTGAATATASLKVNGELVTFSNFSGAGNPIAADSASITIGNDSTTASTWGGFIDFVEFWDMSTNTLVGNWGLSQSNDSTAIDATGNANGTITGAIWYRESLQDFSGNSNKGVLIGRLGAVNDPQMGRVLDFGSGKRVEIPYHSSFNYTTSHAGMAWIYPRSLGDSNSGRIFDHRNGAFGSNGFAFILRAGNQLALLNGSQLYVSNNDAVVLNRWQHVAYVHDDATDTLTFYVNGVAHTIVTGATVNPPQSLTPIAIGNSVPETTRSFDGYIHRLFLANTLTAQEIMGEYMAHRPL